MLVCQVVYLALQLAIVCVLYNFSCRKERHQPSGWIEIDRGIMWYKIRSSLAAPGVTLLSPEKKNWVCEETELSLGPKAK